MVVCWCFGFCSTSEKPKSIHRLTANITTMVPTFRLIASADQRINKNEEKEKRNIESFANAPNSARRLGASNIFYLIYTYLYIRSYTKIERKKMKQTRRGWIEGTIAQRVGIFLRHIFGSQAAIRGHDDFFGGV